MKYLLAIATLVHFAFIGLVAYINQIEQIDGGWISVAILLFTSIPAIYGTWAAWSTNDNRSTVFS